jgi:hypothetical protein
MHCKIIDEIKTYIPIWPLPVKRESANFKMKTLSRPITSHIYGKLMIQRKEKYPKNEKHQLKRYIFDGVECN